MTGAMSAQALVFVRQVEDFFVLLMQTLRGTLTPPFRVRSMVNQAVYIGWESLPVILFCVCFAAVVTVIESSFHMKLVVQSDELVPGFAALLILRELAVVVSCLLITSRVGAGIAAEVGSMQITEQIDALRMLGIDPVRFLVVPRFVASVLGCALVSTVASVVCVYAAMLVADFRLGHSSATFLMGVRAFVDYQDLVFATIKGAVFGAVIPVVSCFYGFRCESGAEGVGRATTQAVVTSSIAIIILDFCLSWMFSFFY